MAQGDLGGEGFKVIACLGTCGRLAKIAIKHVDPLGVPAQALGAADQGEVVKELTLREVMPGMIFAEDVRGKNGNMLIARGQEVTPNLAERIRNMAATANVIEPVRVLMPAARPLSAAS